MKISGLLEKPSNKIVGILFLVSFVLYFVFNGLLFTPLFAQYPAGYGFLDFKFAWTKAKMDEIIGVWMAHPEDLIGIMINVHIIDFFFMAVYGTLLSTGTLLIARAVGSSDKLQKFYLWSFFLGWIAVLLDIIEGINIYAVLFNPTNVQEINTFSAALSATICIYIIQLNILLILIGLIIAIVLYLKNRNS